MALSPLIKELALQAIEDSAPTKITFGKVIKVDPLEIYIDPKLIIKEENGQIKLTRNVTDFVTDITPVNWETESTSGGAEYDSFASHNHALNGRKRVIIHNSLAVDDSVILLRMQGGQVFIVIDKIGTAGSGSGSGSADGGVYEFYNGAYVLTSSSTEQTMSTKNKIMLDDVTIESMPRTEVENDGGGTTIIIG